MILFVCLHTIWFGLVPPIVFTLFLRCFVTYVPGSGPPFIFIVHLHRSWFQIECTFWWAKNEIFDIFLPVGVGPSKVSRDIGLRSLGPHGRCTVRRAVV